MSDIVKVIYIVQRKSSDDPGSFIRLWRDHAALGMSMERWRNVRRYAHCDILGELDTTGSTADTQYGGIGISWYRSAAHRAAHVADRSAQARMLEDEKRKFHQLVATSPTSCEETVLICARVKPHRKIVRLITKSASLSGAEFQKSWTAYSNDLIQRYGSTLVGYVQNVIGDPAKLRDPLSCDIIDELSFASTDSFNRLVADYAGITTCTIDGSVIASARAFITNEIVLYEAAGQ